MKSQQKKILILTIKVGAGHTKAAEAMKEAFVQQSPDNIVEIIDAFDYANPLLGKMIVTTYMELIKVTPYLYNYLYTKAEIKTDSFSKKEFLKILNKLTDSKLVALLDEFQPDVIICTHPFPLGIVTIIKERLELTIPIVAVITDFTVHPFWIFNNVETYIVAAPQLKENLIGLGVLEERIMVTGIPIDPKFRCVLDKPSVRRKLGVLSQPSTILLMGGGLGLGPLKNIVKTLNNSELDYQLLVVVGKNENLQKKLKDMLPDLRLNIKVYGFIENIYEFMEIADLIITKPGGLTSSEALAKGLPMILIDPIPGQEERNCDFLISNGVAIRATDEDSLIRTLQRLIDRPEEVFKMKSRAKDLGRADSALEVAELIYAEYLEVDKGGVLHNERSLPS